MTDSEQAPSDPPVDKTVEEIIASIEVPQVAGVKQIYAAVAGMLACVQAIKKGKEARLLGYWFRGIDDVYNAVNPLLAKFGVFPSAKVLRHDQIERETKAGSLQVFTIMHMRYRFFAADGSSVVTESVGEAADTGDKSTNKAMSVAYKYAMFQLLCIPTEAIDPDATIPDESVPKNREINKGAKGRARGKVVEPPASKAAPVEPAPGFDVAGTRKAIAEASSAGALMTIERAINQAGMAERVDKATWEQLLFGVLSSAVKFGLSVKRVHNYRDRKMLDAERVAVLEQAIETAAAAAKPAEATEGATETPSTEGVASGDQASTAE